MRLSLRDPSTRSALTLPRAPSALALPRWAALSALMATPCLGRAATAEVPTAAQREADDHFEQGKAALKRGAWTVACERFRFSLQLDPTPSSHIKVARCHERDAAPRLAWHEYQQALEKLRSRPRDRHSQELLDLVTSAQAVLAKKLGTLRVAFSQVVSEAGIVIDGQPVTPQAAQSGIVLDPGQHRVEASVTNYRIEPVHVELAAGEQRTVRIELGASDPAPTKAVDSSSAKVPVGVGAQTPTSGGTVAIVPKRAVATPPFTTATSASGQTKLSSSGAQRWVGIAASGLGLAFFGVAGYLGIRTHARVRDARENDHCNADYLCDSVGMARLDEAEQLQTEALVFTVAGTLLGATGIVLWATAPTRRTDEPRSVPKIGLRVSPWGTSVGGIF